MFFTLGADMKVMNVPVETNRATSEDWVRQTSRNGVSIVIPNIIPKFSVDKSDQASSVHVGAPLHNLAIMTGKERVA